MTPFETRASPRLVAGPGALERLPECVRDAGGGRALIVTDAGIVSAGHAARAEALMRQAGIEVVIYDETRENPVESDVLACRDFAARLGVDCVVGLGGGSSLDTAKGCNLLLTNDGAVSDYRGYGRAMQPMLPFVAVPTTAGTGSECQSYAVISRDDSHEKMACGDPKMLAKVAILDPELTVSMPSRVAVLTALDALAHALETAVCTRRNPLSSAFSREAFERIASSIECVLRDEAGLAERSEMLLGAAFSGLAIENSMLGAAHAAANPLTSRLGLAHGHAVALMLPAVLRFNREDESARAIYAGYGGLLVRGGRFEGSLEAWVGRLLGLAGLPEPAKCGVPPELIPELAADAARQWTGRFNPRPVSETEFTRLYRDAFQVKGGRTFNAPE